MVPKPVTSDSSWGSERWANRPPAANTGRTSVKSYLKLTSPRYKQSCLQKHDGEMNKNIPLHCRLPVRVSSSLVV